MAKPTKSAIQKLQYSGTGGPFCKIAARTGMDMDSLKYSQTGAPFWAVADESSAIINIYLGSIPVPTLAIGANVGDSVWLGSTFIQ